MIVAAAELTSVSLGAGASYLGPLFDGGTEPALWPTRVRPTIVHATAAKNAPGYLVLEELIGGAWTETRRSPIPADGEAHTFDWPLHTRYHRLRFYNGAQAQTLMRLMTLAVRDDGGSIDEHEVITMLLSNTPLGASAQFVGPTIDLGSNSSRVAVRLASRADQPSASGGGGLYLSWSDDGSYWWAAADANISTTGSGITEAKACARYVRAQYANGATAQTVFRLLLTLISL